MPTLLFSSAFYWLPPPQLTGCSIVVSVSLRQQQASKQANGWPAIELNKMMRLLEWTTKAKLAVEISMLANQKSM